MPSSDGGSAALADRLVDHRLTLLRYEAGVVRRMGDALGKALPALAAEAATLARQLQALPPPVTPKDRRKAAELLEKVRLLQDRMAAVRAELRAAGPMVAATITEARAAAVRAELGFQRTVAARTVAVSWVTPNTEQVLTALARSIGPDDPAVRIAPELIAATEDIQQALAQAMTRGLAIPKVAADLRRIEGIAETYRGRFETIARTEVMRVSNQAALATYRANRDVLEAVEWLATLDSRTCLLCAPLHGTVYVLGPDGQPVGLEVPPPRHPRCRCFLAPIVRGDDRIPAVDFSAWLRRQSAEDRIAILGPARARLFARGVPLAGFSDARGILTLAELDARYPDA